MRSSARLAALPSDKCAQCNTAKLYHCDLDEPGVDHKDTCRLIHHEFVEKPERELTNSEKIGRLNERIKGIEFDIAMLQRVKDGWIRNGKQIRDLKSALRGYEEQRDALANKG
jgi:hypothetical protein